MSGKCHKQSRVEAFIECSAAQFANQKSAAWFIWMPIVILAVLAQTMWWLATK